MTKATDIFADLFGYNAWANGKLFELCRGVDRERIDADAPGTTGTIGETISHLVGVEDAYLAMLQDQPLGNPESRTSYFAHDAEWFMARGAQVGERYLAILPTFDDERLESPLLVPWFDFQLTKRDGLYQVLAHTAQHRAQILSVLGSAGVKVPDVDYVLQVRERLASKS